MWQCPVCTTNNDNHHSLCTKCGFDERTDFVAFRTLCMVSVMDYQMRKNQEKAQSSVESAPTTQPNVPECDRLEVVQKAFKEAFDKSILNPQTVSVDIVREELLKQGYEITNFKNKKRIWERSHYCFDASGRLPRNYSTSYDVSYLEHYDGKACSAKTFLFMGMPGGNVSLDAKDAIDRMTPLPFEIKMWDSYETVQKKLGLTESGLTENLETLETVVSGYFIELNGDCTSIHIKFEKESYTFEFYQPSMRLSWYTADFSK